MNETTRNFEPVLARDEISIRDVILTVRRRKWIIAAITALAVLIGLLYAVFATPMYTASIAVSPATKDDSGLSSIAGRLGGVAALAGFNLGSGGSEKEDYLAILQSRELGERFIDRYQLKPDLFPKRWNAAAEKWKEGAPNKGFRAFISRTLARLSGDEGWREADSFIPTDWEAYKRFDDKVRSVKEDTDTGIVTVSFEFRNPAMAAQWANDYVAMANEEIRQRAIAESSRALAYLNEQVEKTTISGLRDTIYQLVEHQLETITLANSREEYAFRVIDKAVVPEQRSHPQRSVILVLSLVLGLVLGGAAVFLMEAYPMLMRESR